MGCFCLLEGWMDFFFSSFFVWQRLLDQAFCIYEEISSYLLMVSFSWRLNCTYFPVRLVHNRMLPLSLRHDRSESTRSSKAVPLRLKIHILIEVFRLSRHCVIKMIWSCTVVRFDKCDGFSLISNVVGVLCRCLRRAFQAQVKSSKQSAKMAVTRPNRRWHQHGRVGRCLDTSHVKSTINERAIVSLVGDNVMHRERNPNPAYPKNAI
jgi:hypothetical protein